MVPKVEQSIKYSEIIIQLWRMRDYRYLLFNAPRVSCCNGAAGIKTQQCAWPKLQLQSNNSCVSTVVQVQIHSVKYVKDSGGAGNATGRR